MITILVVEDHADTLAVLTRLLTSRGYGVLGAASAEEAIAIAADISCDLLITDVGLPGRNGIELLHDLKAQYGLKGIALTGHVFPKDISEAETAGVDRFIAKPMDFDVLLTAIQELAPKIDETQNEKIRIRREKFRCKLEGRA